MPPPQGDYDEEYGDYDDAESMDSEMERMMMEADTEGLELTPGDALTVWSGSLMVYVDHISNLLLMYLMLLESPDNGQRILNMLIVIGVTFVVQGVTLTFVAPKRTWLYLPVYLCCCQQMTEVFESYERGDKTWAWQTLMVLHAFGIALPNAFMQGYWYLAPASHVNHWWVRKISLPISVAMVALVLLYEFRGRNGPILGEQKRLFWLQKLIEATYTWCEVALTIGIWVLAYATLGTATTMLWVVVYYAALVCSWRWWSVNQKDRVFVFGMALVLSPWNMFGALTTGGDSCTSYVYSVPYGPCSYLPAESREFMRNGVWLPDFLGLLAVRDAMQLFIMVSVSNTGLPAVSKWAGAELSVYFNMAVAFIIVMHLMLLAYGLLWWKYEWGAKSAAANRPHLQKRRERERKRKGLPPTDKVWERDEAARKVAYGVYKQSVAARAKSAIGAGAASVVSHARERLGSRMPFKSMVDGMSSVGSGDRGAGGGGMCRCCRRRRPARTAPELAVQAVPASHTRERRCCRCCRCFCKRKAASAAVLRVAAKGTGKIADGDNRSAAPSVDLSVSELERDRGSQQGDATETDPKATKSRFGGAAKLWQSRLGEDEGGSTAEALPTATATAAAAAASSPAAASGAATPATAAGLQASGVGRSSKEVPASAAPSRKTISASGKRLSKASMGSRTSKGSRGSRGKHKHGKHRGKHGNH